MKKKIIITTIIALLVLVPIVYVQMNKTIHVKDNVTLKIFAYPEPEKEMHITDQDDVKKVVDLINNSKKGFNTIFRTFGWSKILSFSDHQELIYFEKNYMVINGITYEMEYKFDEQLNNLIDSFEYPLEDRF